MHQEILHQTILGQRKHQKIVICILSSPERSIRLDGKQRKGWEQGKGISVSVWNWQGGVCSRYSNEALLGAMQVLGCRKPLPIAYLWKYKTSCSLVLSPRCRHGWLLLPFFPSLKLRRLLYHQAWWLVAESWKAYVLLCNIFIGLIRLL